MDRREALAESRKQATIKFTAYKKTFSGPDGEAVLEDLKNAFHFMGSTFVAGDPYESAHNDGARAVVVRIIEMLNIDLDEYLTRMELNQGEEEDEELELQLPFDE